MNKAQFISSVVKQGKYSTKAEAARAYDAVVWAFANRLSTGTPKQRVIRLPELGTFQMKTRKETSNPVFFFTASKLRIAYFGFLSLETSKNL